MEEEFEFAFYGEESESIAANHNNNDEDHPSLIAYRAVAAAIEFHHHPQQAGAFPSLHMHREAVKKQPQPPVEVILNPSALKCPSKPCSLTGCGKGTFYTQTTLRELPILVEKIDETLKAIDDYDISFQEKDCQWRCKYFYGSNVREVTVSLYWDAVALDHLLEVRRMKGDGMLCAQPQFAGKKENKSPTDILETLQAKILPVPSSSSSATASSEGTPAKKGGRLRGALPMPLPVLSSSASSSSSSVPGKEQFLQGLEPLLSMARSLSLETRLEGAKMLCDLAENTPQLLLSLPECQDVIFQALSLFLTNPIVEDSSSISSLLMMVGGQSNHHEDDNEFDEIKQFAVMAFGMFCEFEPYQECFLHFKNCDYLLRLIENPSRPSISYQTIQMRRQAAKGLAKLVKKACSNQTSSSHKICLMKLLEVQGFANEFEWKTHCQTISDSRLRNHANEIALCFA